MATNITGRSGSRFGRTTTTRTTGTWGNRTKKNVVNVPTSHKNVSKSFQGKIDSYKMLYKQTCGTAKHHRPSPTILNTFANWINKGAVVQTVTCSQVAKWAKADNKNFNTRNPTVASCKNVLTAKFGKSTIKCCARTKTGGFMIATTPTWKGKPFCFPKC